MVIAVLLDSCLLKKSRCKDKHTKSVNVFDDRLVRLIRTLKYISKEIDVAMETYFIMQIEEYTHSLL
jgi:hypothetical protein